MSFGRTRLIGTGIKNRKHLDKFKPLEDEAIWKISKKYQLLQLCAKGKLVNGKTADVSKIYI